jgi:hypothetical protein
MYSLKKMAADFVEKGDLNSLKFLEAEQTSLADILSVEWTYISASPICLCGVNRENFTFLPSLPNAFHFIIPCLSYRLYVQSF